MSLAPEILAAQQAYAARPYAASVVTGNFSGTFRFNTYEDAVAYLRQQINRRGIMPVRSANNWSNDGVRPSHQDTFVSMPDGSRRDIASLGIAALPHGPLANWIIL